MSLIIRSRYIRPSKPVCEKDCKDRKAGCHSKCQKYLEWQRENWERKKAIKKYNKSIADIEEYEIKEKQKNIKRR